MKALDTSVLARLILRDNPGEFRRAVQLVGSQPCMVSWSVLVELSWVLERSARLPRDQVAAALSEIARSTDISVPDRAGLTWAVDRYRRGADFADMVHLLSTEASATAFATFDRKLARQAGEKTPVPVETIRG